MLPAIFRVLKVGALGLYGAVIASFWLESLKEYQMALVTVMAVLFAVHVVEYVVVFNRLKKRAGEKSNHFLQVLLFGFLHWIPLLHNSKARD